jgi:hypothetical protein
VSVRLTWSLTLCCCIADPDPPLVNWLTLRLLQVTAGQRAASEL